MTSPANTAGKILIIVESPAKARTVSGILGDRYIVNASMGHVRDLPPKEIGIDPANNFKPNYQVIPDKRDTVSRIKQAGAQAAQILLATDPDREGEAIAWHLIQAAGWQKLNPQRVVFHEITPEAVTQALNEARPLDQDLVDAQQARRLLDRLVGYELSPLVSNRLGGKLSAGRVQSAALCLLTDREAAIINFKVTHTWQLLARLRQLPDGSPQFIAVHQTEFPTEKEANDRLANLHGAKWQVAKFTERESDQLPPAPFTTSSLQQEASRKLNFNPTQTMQLAQQLYEGAGQPKGLITYMRTDSVHLADVAVAAIRDWIAANQPPAYLPDQPIKHQTRSKLAQEAHEAIRPTEPGHHPNDLADRLSAEQLSLYRLIWTRATASQMAPARLQTRQAEITAQGPEGPETFIARGVQTLFPGFKALYEESVDDAGEETGETGLPRLEPGEELLAVSIESRRKDTKPPPRFTEAGLVQELERRGIGRPSTYASMVNILTARHYAAKAGRHLKPSNTGVNLAQALQAHFPDLTSSEYTAKLENSLDQVAGGQVNWLTTLDDFYQDFSASMQAARTNMVAAAAPELTEEAARTECPECGGAMQARNGRRGPFLSCNGYPECKGIVNLDQAGNAAPPETTEHRCPECAKPMRKLAGKKGVFLGCTGYPDCKTTRELDPAGNPIEPERAEEPCPECGKPLLQRKGKYGNFFGCAGYPNCKYIQRNEGDAGPENAGPTAPCPSCETGALRARQGKNGTFYGCSNYPACRHTAQTLETEPEPALPGE